MSARPRLPSQRDRPPRDRLPRRGRHRDLALRPAGPADPARRRRDGPQAAADRRRPRRELRRLHALRRLAARQARPAAGLPAQPRDRAALPRRRDAARAAARALRSSGRSRGSRASARAAAASCSASRSGSCSCRAPGPCSRRSRSSRRTTTSAGARSLLTLAYALGAAVPMAADRASAAAGSRAGCARMPSSSGSRRASLIALVALGIAFNVDDRASRPRCRATPQAFQKRVESSVDRAARAREAARRAAAARREDDADGDRAGLPDYGVAPALASRRRLVQHAAAHAEAAARQGRADRLLDVLVHQLPAHAAAPEGVGRGLPLARARDRRRPHAGVRVRARRLERRATR